ncbi:MAG: helix-turn-helix domain-containing protein [Phycisphaerae bacterium]|nr:helix-turn-helix domain-containing protein [Phycisphaerae bacterium]
MQAIEATNLADARIDDVRKYLVELSRREPGGAAFRLGRRELRDRVGDGEAVDRWRTARRIARQREELSGREAAEERARCRAIVDELAVRLSIDGDALEKLLIEIHDPDVADDAVPADVVALIDIEGVARKLGVSVASVRRLVNDGALPKPLRLRSMVRWSRTSIDRWLESVAS